MKRLSLLLILLLVHCALSAETARALNWYASASLPQGLPDFEGSLHTNENPLPYFSESIRPEQNAASYRVQLLFPTFCKLTPAEVDALRPYLSFLSDTIVPTVRVGVERKRAVLDLSFLPFVRKKDGYYRLLAFDWQIQPVQAALRSTATVSYAANSVLASGKWFKISVKESGVYKLTYEELRAMGIRPERAQIYGYGGKLLNENFQLPGYADDLPAVAVYRSLGSDSVFNSGDYLLFYAQGPISWSYSAGTGMYLRTRNLYSDKGYYFVGERQEGTVEASRSTYSGTPNKEVTAFTDFLLHEVDKVNMGESVAGKGTGRELFGEDFLLSTSQTFPFRVANPDTTATSSLYAEFVANSAQSTYASVYVNNNYLSSMSFAPIGASEDYKYGVEDNTWAGFRAGSGDNRVRIDYGKGQTNSLSRAYLDYIVLNLRRFLKMAGSSMAFRDPVSVGGLNVGRFSIQNASANLLVFDVTNPANMVRMQGTWESGTYRFVNTLSTLHEYVAVEPSAALPSPTLEGAVPNQNLHALSGVDMVVVAPTEFVPYAQKLADAHAAIDGTRVAVVTPEQVYNEFSSGTPDATAIRRMMKRYYDASSGTSAQPNHLLLFGDGVYDNRLVTGKFATLSNRPNKILTYQSVESLNGHSSYVTDDYFGFLDDSEGSDLSTARLDIGIGRFPVSTTSEANVLVNKTIAYMKNLKKGSWKNRLLFLADDGADPKDNYTHIIQADELAEQIGNAHPEYMVNKVYLDAYTKVVSASGVTVPDANRRFKELLDAGVFLVNYTGHGSPAQWADEKLLMASDIQAMSNPCLPLWVTATCEFTRFDAADRSGGEMVLLKEGGGGVALFTTTRVVYSSNNLIMNHYFLESLFAKKNGHFGTLGDVVTEAKGVSSLYSDDNKLCFTLVGDPSLRLSYPEYTAKVTEINDRTVGTRIDTLGALARVTVSGQVYDANGLPATDFTGIVTPVILDASQVLAHIEQSPGQFLTYQDRSKVLFNGKDSVVNGRFRFSFVVPKDNSYSYRNGRINLYAWSAEGTNEAQGSYDNFVIGGTDSTAAFDRQGPAISLFLNDESFVNGGAVPESATLIARLSDVSGLNTSGSGVGHDLVLMVDDDPDRTYTLNSWFVADVGSIGSGVVRFRMPTLNAGKHRLVFRAWDAQNNVSEDTLSFEVRPGMEGRVADIRYYQSGGTGWFRFEHDRPQLNEAVSLEVVDLLGRILWRTNFAMQTEDNTGDPVEWNLTDGQGRRVANGIYLCRIRLQDANGAAAFGTKKIVVTGQ